MIGIALIAVAAATHPHGGRSRRAILTATGYAVAGMPVIEWLYARQRAGWWRPSPVSRAVLICLASLPGSRDPVVAGLDLPDFGSCRPGSSPGYASLSTHDAVLVFAVRQGHVVFGGVP